MNVHQTQAVHPQHSSHIQTKPSKNELEKRYRVKGQGQGRAVADADECLNLLTVNGIASIALK